ncbi:MAG TPA: alpha/beta hydrolase [Baekduia sp.]|nr:alpha/beta hydrolase [Baekduia sp.]
MLDGLHPQVRALMAAAGAEDGEQGPPDLAAERAAYLDTALRLGGAAEPVAATEDVVVPSGEARLPARLYVPQHAPETTGLLVWFHGGGWYMGDIEGFDRVGRALANASGLRTLVPEYRLAPEHPWPVPADDARATMAWARTAAGAGQLRADPARVLVGGDSAGGQLAALAARDARSDGAPPLLAQLLVYPALDAAMDSDAYRELADAPMLTADDMRVCWQRYLGDRADGAHDADVLSAADHEGLPPTWVAVAGIDPLRDDGLRYAAALRDSGVPVEATCFDDMTHGFLRWGGVVDRTRELLDWLGGAARAVTAERDGAAPG